MGIISGFLKTKKYRKTENGYQLQSEWTSSQTVEMDDGFILEDKIDSIQTDISEIRAEVGEKANSAHNQSASTITAGTFGGTVKAPASTAYTTAEVRNGVIVATDPGEGATVSYPNGTIIFSKG